MKFRDRWNRFVCRWRKHPITEPKRQFIMSEKDGITATDTWKTCRCGLKSGPLTRIRIRLPYEVKQ